MTKKDARLDEWAKDVAPSQELRRWYGHDPLRFDEFSRRIVRELRHAPCADIVSRLLEFAREDGVAILSCNRATSSARALACWNSTCSPIAIPDRRRQREGEACDRTLKQPLATRRGRRVG